MTLEELAQALSEAFEAHEWGDVDPYLLKEVVEPVEDSSYAADAHALRATLQLVVDKLNTPEVRSVSTNSVLPCGIGFAGFGSGHVCGLPAGHEGAHRVLDVPPLSPGLCGDAFVTFGTGPDRMSIVCGLPAGHEGVHRALDTSRHIGEWPPSPRTPLQSQFAQLSDKEAEAVWRTLSLWAWDDNESNRRGEERPLGFDERFNLFSALGRLNAAMASPTPVQKTFIDTTAEHHYLRGDATDRTRSFLMGVASTLFRIDNGRRATDDEETELQRMLDEWVRS